MHQPLELSESPDWQIAWETIVGIFLLASICLCVSWLLVAGLRVWRAGLQVYMCVCFLVRAPNMVLTNYWKQRIGL